MFLHALATTLIVGPFAFILGAWWASRDKFDAAADRAEPECLNCDDCGWVCENHRDQPWAGISSVAHACDCGGAGSPCPICEWDMATAGFTETIRRLQLKMDAIRDLIETPRTIRKGELSAIVNGDAEVARLRGA